jgi:hypothetical protein
VHLVTADIVNEAIETLENPYQKVPKNIFLVINIWKK